MKCENHEEREAAGTCVGCGRPFCDECMMTVGKKKYCEECAKEELKKKTKENDQKQQNITVTQQTTTQEEEGSEKPPGSVLVLCIWIILFWPIAIIYYLRRRWD